MGAVAEFFFEDVRHIEFSGDVEDLYPVELGKFSHVVFKETEVIHSLCCEMFYQSKQVWLSL